MKLHSRSSQTNGNHRAIFWALLTQTIWLPVFISGSQEEWTSKTSHANLLSGLDMMQKPLGKDQFNPTSKTIGSGTPQFQPFTGNRKQHTGLVLNTLLPNHSVTSPDSTQIYSAANSTSGKSIFLPRHANVSDTDKPTVTMSNRSWLATRATQPGVYSSTGLMQRMYSRSELLGGTLTLQDLNEPVMPPLARAERVQWSRSGDPLASLPQIWREPMRRALSSLAKSVLSSKGEASGTSVQSINIDPARFVHVPSTRIRQSSEVPLALQADGSVDILNQPEDPAVIDEINRWSAKQRLPEKGKISPAVVHLHPMEPLEIGRSGSEKINTQTIETSKTRTTPSAIPPAPSTEPSTVSATPPIETQPAPSGRASGVGVSTTPISSAAPANSAAPISSSAPAPVNDTAPRSSSEAES